MKNWKKINLALTSWFGFGFVPVAPGTAGSVAAIPFILLVKSSGSLWLELSISIGLTALAILVSYNDQRFGETKDPSYIVIDEVAGMFWACLPVALSLESGFRDSVFVWKLLAAFVLFRIFDVLKPFPANRIDRSSKVLSSSFGRGAAIVMDDVIAGIYAAAVILAADFFL